MAIDDEQTYGFRKADALELVQLIGNADGEHTAWHPVPGEAGGSASKFAAEMQSTWSAKAVSCDIYTLSGASLVSLETATVYDPLEVFRSLTTGDWLYCTYQDGKYYAADAADCTGLSPLIATPPEG